MLLSQLLKNITVGKSYNDVEITKIVTDSREVENGSLFVCTQGRRVDSHIFIPDAFERGASAVICTKETDYNNCITVENTAKALATICSNFYGNPEKKLKLIGVTGTNGKTSTTHIIKRILEFSGKKAGLIGTVSYISGNEKLGSATLTTPEPPELYRIFADMVKSECEYCVMEVSSQSLAQSRCLGLTFEVAVFTNLSQDHLDYHITMENYAAAKAKLFAQSKVSVLNMDDEASGLMVNENSAVHWFSLENSSAEFYADDIKVEKEYCEFNANRADKSAKIKINIPGKFTVYNSLAATACCYCLGFSLKDTASALLEMDSVPGRAEVLKTNTPYTVVIDYAHSPDAMKNILSSVRQFAKGRVVSLFGCGGERDKTKRPLMARAAAEYSDYVIITTDNPRSENPNSIIEDIIPGINGKRTPCAIIPERTFAIDFAIKNAREGDVIVLCGKGHETHQIIGDKKIHYDEREVVADIIEKLY